MQSDMESFILHTAADKKKGWYLRGSRMTASCSESQHMYIDKVHVMENPTVTRTRWREIYSEWQ